MLLLPSACAEKCDLLNPNACGLYDCGGNSWSPDETKDNGDNLSLRSGQVNMIGTSRVCMKATGPGLVKFIWKVDPMAQHVGTLGFWVDNAQVAVCKSQEWAPISYSLRERRDYDLAWQFHKFKSIPAGMGAGWIDDLDAIGENLRIMPEITSQTSSDYPEINASSSNFANKSAINPTNCTQLNRSCCNCETELNEISACKKNTKFPAIQVPIIMPPPNITVNIELNPMVNFSTNLVQSQNLSMNHPSNNSHSPPLKCNKIIVGSCNCTLGKNAARYSRIRDAILNSSDGDDIFICNGTYDETLIIDRSLNISGESRSGTRIESNEETIIKVRHKNVTLEHLSIINLGHCGALAIGVESSDDITISDCEIRNCSNGIEINNSMNAHIKKNHIFMDENNKNKSKNKYAEKIIGIRLKSKYPGAIISDNIIIMGGNDSINSYGIGFYGATGDFDFLNCNTAKPSGCCNNEIDVSRCRIMYFDGNNNESQCYIYDPKNIYND
jgi:parallel beta-helix repeat protein